MEIIISEEVVKEASDIMKQQNATKEEDKSKQEATPTQKIDITKIDRDNNCFIELAKTTMIMERHHHHQREQVVIMHYGYVFIFQLQEQEEEAALGAIIDDIIMEMKSEQMSIIAVDTHASVFFEKNIQKHAMNHRACAQTMGFSHKHKRYVIVF